MIISLIGKGNSNTTFTIKHCPQTHTLPFTVESRGKVTKLVKRLKKHDV